MSIFGKKKEVTKVNLIHVDGLMGYGSAVVILNLDDDNKCITINPKVYKVPPVHLRYEQIINIGSITEEEIIEKNKSTVGRALAGGLLLGPLGAIVGGMSGIGTNKSNKTTYYMVINYKSLEEETKALSFKIMDFTAWADFIWSVRRRIKKVEEIPKEIYL